jgi:hypothetical protein
MTFPLPLAGTVGVDMPRAPLSDPPPQGGKEKARSSPRLLRRRRRPDLIKPRAHVIDEIARIRFRHAEDAQRIKPARTLDADRVPEKAAHMGDFGDVRERQVFVDAPPRRQPEIDIGGGDADRVGGHGRGKQKPRAVEMKQRPQPARADGDAGGGG